MEGEDRDHTYNLCMEKNKMKTKKNRNKVTESVELTILKCEDADRDTLLPAYLSNYIETAHLTSKNTQG